jgi:hypothetical protein
MGFHGVPLLLLLSEVDRRGLSVSRNRFHALIRLRLALMPDIVGEPGGRAPFRVGSQCPFRLAAMTGSVTSPHIRHCHPE